MNTQPVKLDDLAAAFAAIPVTGRNTVESRPLARDSPEERRTPAPTAAVQKLTFVENVMRRIPDADVGCRKNGDVTIPLYPE